MQVLYLGKSYTLEEGESVLDCLLRCGVSAPHSCKAGICQTCMMKLADGKIPEKARGGLKPSLKQLGFFLACQCVPEMDITVQLPNEAEVSVKVSIIDKQNLNHNVLRLRLRTDEMFVCMAGQYIVLTNHCGVSRNYSIANLPEKDGYIELHIRIIPDGKMSMWLLEHAKIGDEVTLRGAMGDCFYLAEANIDYPIILVGTGTGLAPLYGIIRDALGQGHCGSITLYHGALKMQDLYYVDELNKLANKNSNFTYIPCVLNGEEGQFYRLGNIENIVMSDLPDDKNNIRLYLCGAQDMVNSMQVKAFLAGVSPNNIHLDAFLPSK